MEENIISEPTENVIPEASENLPETSPVFDDFSKTDFFSENTVDEIPQNNDPTPENNSQIVPFLSENPTPLATLVDLTLSSESEPISS